MEYQIDENEISRRKKAFITLSISILAGLFLSSKTLNYPLPFIYYIIFIIALVLSNILLYRFFGSIRQSKVTLSNQTLEKVNLNKTESFARADIKAIKIKTTTRNSIREIFIQFKDGTSTFINGLKDFKQFRDNLVTKDEQNIKVEETREPIDFDHPLFYSLLGLPISFIGIYLVKLLLNLDYNILIYAFYIFSIYLLAMGLYFIIAKPISRRYGNKKIAADYMFGFVLILFGASILLLGLL